MVRRHRALVAPPQLDAIPRQRVLAHRREQLVHALWRRATRERDVKRPLRGASELREVLRARAAHRLEVCIPLDLHPPAGRDSWWPPNWKRIADSTFSANEWSWRERNRVNS